MQHLHISIVRISGLQLNVRPGSLTLVRTDTWPCLQLPGIYIAEEVCLVAGRLSILASTHRTEPSALYSSGKPMQRVVASARAERRRSGRAYTAPDDKFSWKSCMVESKRTLSEETDMVRRITWSSIPISRK